MIFAIVAFGVCLYHFFINHIDSNINYIFSFLAFMFLFLGIEDVLQREKEKKPFSLYLLAALLLFLVLGIDLLKILI